MRNLDYEKLALQNGSSELEGKRYAFMRESYIDDDGKVTARAVLVGEEPADELVGLYLLKWDCDDFESCDWDDPSDVERVDVVDLHEPTEYELKWAEVEKLSRWGKYPQTYLANVSRVAALPETILDKLDAPELAALVDAFHDCYHDGDMAGRRRNE